MKILFCHFGQLIDRVLKFFHLPTLKKIRYRKVLSRRITETQNQIQQLYHESEELTYSEIDLVVPEPDKSRDIVPKVFVPESTIESIPSLVERRRARHSVKMDTMEAIALKAESRLQENKISAASANLGAMKELQAEEAGNMYFEKLVARISEQLP